MRARHEMRGIDVADEQTAQRFTERPTRNALDHRDQIRPERASHLRQLALSLRHPPAVGAGQEHRDAIPAAVAADPVDRPVLIGEGPAPGADLATTDVRDILLAALGLA